MYIKYAHKNIKLYISIVLILFFFPHSLNASEVLRTDKELLANIAVTNKERVPYVLYSIGPIDLEVGAVVDIRVQAVLSNECNGNTGIGRYIVRTKERFSVQGKRVVKAVMSNTTLSDHHAVIVHSGIELIDRASQNNYYNFVVYAQSTLCEGNFLKVEGYNDDAFGELIVLKH